MPLLPRLTNLESGSNMSGTSCDLQTPTLQVDYTLTPGPDESHFLSIDMEPENWSPRISACVAPNQVSLEARDGWLVVSDAEVWPNRPATEDDPGVDNPTLKGHVVGPADLLRSIYTFYFSLWAQP